MSSFSKVSSGTSPSRLPRRPDRADADGIQRRRGGRLRGSVRPPSIVADCWQLLSHSGVRKDRDTVCRRSVQHNSFGSGSLDPGSYQVKCAKGGGVGHEQGLCVLRSQPPVCASYPQGCCLICAPQVVRVAPRSARGPLQQFVRFLLSECVAATNFLIR